MIKILVIDISKTKEGLKFIGGGGVKTKQDKNYQERVKCKCLATTLCRLI